MLCFVIINSFKKQQLFCVSILSKKTSSQSCVFFLLLSLMWILTKITWQTECNTAMFHSIPIDKSLWPVGLGSVPLEDSIPSPAPQFFPLKSKQKCTVCFSDHTHTVTIIKAFIKRKLLSTETIHSTCTHTHTHTPAPAHMSIPTTQNLIYTQLKTGSKQRLGKDEKTVEDSSTGW